MIKFSEIKMVRIYKDNWTPTKPWCADLIYSDGRELKKYNFGYMTKKRLLREVNAVMETASCSPEIVRGEDRGQI
jgi:hypothetical protein